MAHQGGFGASRLTRVGLGVAAAGFGTAALTGYTWLSARGSVPTPDVSAVILALIALGVAAGWISGRFRIAAVSWIAAVVGSILAYTVTSAMDPGLPQPDSSFSGHELLNAAFLVPWIAGGHLLGAWVGRASPRRIVGAAIGGVGSFAVFLLAFSGITDGATGIAGIAIVLLVWVGSGATAGLISGRLTDAAASWAVAVIGFLLAYLVCHGIPQGSSGPVEVLLYGPLTLLLFVAGGHLLGSTAAHAIEAVRKAAA